MPRSFAHRTPRAKDRPFHSRRLLCAGERFQIFRDLVISQGRRIIREWVHRPSISAVIPILKKRRVLLVRQYRYGINRHLWEIPAGMACDGESPRSCARRECEEETGFKPLRLESLGCFAPTPAFADEWVYLYKASSLKKTRKNPETDEKIRVQSFKEPAVKRMLQSGRIQDAKSIIALYRYFSKGRLKIGT